jgi:methyltransferase
MIFTFFISFLIILRLGEMILSKRNEKWLIQHGAVECGKKHYPFLIAMHVLFIAALIVEYYFSGHSHFYAVLLVIFLALTLLKIWIVSLLGKFWTTRIYRIPGAPLIKRGIYKFIKHPNYIIVIIEIAVIPVIFNLYYTAIVFSILNALMLSVRIREENKALAT